MDPWTMIAESVREHILSADRSRQLPWAEIEDGLVAIIDISGFTKLTTYAAERWGAAGGAAMRDILNHPFQLILDRVHAHGGSAVKFAGDAAIVSWRIQTMGEQFKSAACPTAVKALRCCIELLRVFENYEIKIDLEQDNKKGQSEKPRLKIHIGLSYGSTYHCHIGETFQFDRTSSKYPSRSEYFIAGPALDEAGVLLGEGSAGDLVCSFACLQVAGDASLSATFTLCESGSFKTSLSEQLNLSTAESTSPAQVEYPVEKSLPPSPSTEQILHALSYVEESVAAALRENLSAGVKTVEDLNQTRQITTVFIKLGRPSILDIGQKQGLQLAQQILTSSLSLMRKYGGCLRQFNCDDKCATMLMVWGMRGYASEKGQAESAIRAAAFIAEALNDLIENDFSIGVATGNVFTGLIGSEVRSDGTVLGTSVNLAARIMCHRLAHGHVVCDDETYNACATAFTFDTNIPLAMFKGIPTPTPIFVVLKKSSPAAQNSSLQKGGDCFVAGRSNEQQLLNDKLSDWFKNPQLKGRICIFGSSGMGKSTLGSSAVSRYVNEQKLLTCTGLGDESFQSVMFYSYSRLILTICDQLHQRGHNFESMIAGIPNYRKILDVSGAKPGYRIKISGTTAEPMVVDDVKSPHSSESSVISNVFEKFTLRKPLATKSRNSLRVVRPIDGSDKKLRSPSVASHETSGLRSQDFGGKLFSATAARIFELLLTFNEDPINIRWALAALGITENSELVDVQGADKTARLASVFSRLIDGLAKLGYQVLIMLDDVQWMDVSSVKLTLEISRLCPRVFMILMSRPLSEYKQLLAAETSVLLESEGFSVLSIGGLDEIGVEAIIARELNSRTKKCFLLEDDSKFALVRNEIFEKSGGNPFITQILAQMIPDTAGESGGESATKSHEHVPRDVFSAVQARFDQLDPDFKAILRVAAVAGQYFQLDEVAFVLNLIHGTGTSTQTVTDIFQTISRADNFRFLKPVSNLDNSGDDAMAFSHYLLAQGIFQSLIPQQRDEMHGHLLQYYEARIVEDKSLRNMRSLMRHLINVKDRFEAKVKYSFEMFKISASMFQTIEASEDYHSFCDFRDQALERNVFVARSVFDDALEKRLLGLLKFQAGLPYEALEHCFEALRLFGYNFPTVSKDSVRFLLHTIKFTPKFFKVSRMFDDRPRQRRACLRIVRQIFPLAFMGTPFEGSVEPSDIVCDEIVEVLNSILWIIYDGGVVEDNLITVSLLTFATLSISRLLVISAAECLSRAAMFRLLLGFEVSGKRLMNDAMELAQMINKEDPSMWTIKYANTMEFLYLCQSIFGEWARMVESESLTLRTYVSIGLGKSNRAKSAHLWLLQGSQMAGVFSQTTDSVKHFQSLTTAEDKFLHANIAIGICAVYAAANNAREADLWYLSFVKLQDLPLGAYRFCYKVHLKSELMIYHLYKTTTTDPKSFNDVVTAAQEFISMCASTKPIYSELKESLAPFLRLVIKSLTLAVTVWRMSIDVTAVDRITDEHRSAIRDLFLAIERECSNSARDTNNYKRIQWLNVDPLKFCAEVRRIARRGLAYEFVTEFLRNQIIAHAVSVSLLMKSLEHKCHREAETLVAFFDRVGASWESELLRRAM